MLHICNWSVVQRHSKMSTSVQNLELPGVSWSLEVNRFERRSNFNILNNFDLELISYSLQQRQVFALLNKWVVVSRWYRINEKSASFVGNGQESLVVGGVRELSQRIVWGWNGGENAFVVQGSVVVLVEHQQANVVLSIYKRIVSPSVLLKPGSRQQSSVIVHETRSLGP